MQEAIFSKAISASGKMYFIDVKQAKAGKQSKYIQITESRMQDEKRIRSSITIFPDHVEVFAQAFEEAKKYIETK